MNQNEFYPADFEDKEVAPACRERTEKVFSNIMVVLNAIGVSGVYVSDESTLGDFYLSEDELKEMSDKFGFSVTDDDLIVDIAEKMGSFNDV